MKPSLVLNFPDDVQIYVYKCVNRSGWIEYENNGLRKAEQMIRKKYVQFSSNDEMNMPCKVLNITNEEEFMADNLQHIRMPSESMQNYLDQRQTVRILFWMGLFFEVLAWILVITNFNNVSI